MDWNGRNIHVMAKPSGSICNLDCTYCFYLEKEQKLGQVPAVSRMGPEVLEAYITGMIAACDGPDVPFAWQGGEPTLMGVDFFRQVVELQHRHTPPGMRCTNAFQTNGTLLDDEWCRFLAEARFLVGLSIDGPKDIHDARRVDKGGKGSFDRVLRGWERLLRHGVEVNTLTVVGRHNEARGPEVYAFLKSIGSRFHQYIPLVERALPGSRGHLLAGPPGSDPQARVTPWSVSADGYGRFLCDMFDQWIERDVGRVFVGTFDAMLSLWHLGVPSQCIWGVDCGKALALEHDGRLFPCDHYVYPEMALGNIRDSPLETLAAASAQEAFGRDKSRGLTRQCRECRWLPVCHGECPKHRIGTSIHGEPGHNHLCAGLMGFFQHIDFWMRRMSDLLHQGRPPALVMEERAAARRQLAGTGRNDPCPCGSGRKIKVCCGRA